MAMYPLADLISARDKLREARHLALTARDTPIPTNGDSRIVLNLAITSLEDCEDRLSKIIDMLVSGGKTEWHDAVVESIER